jgi:hypothetical protein
MEQKSARETVRPASKRNNFKEAIKWLKVKSVNEGGQRPGPAARNKAARYDA